MSFGGIEDNTAFGGWLAADSGHHRPVNVALMTGLKGTIRDLRHPQPIRSNEMTFDEALHASPTRMRLIGCRSPSGSLFLSQDRPGPRLEQIDA